MDICLHKFSIFIGAPRAQSTIEKQKGINETGAIYKCVFERKSIGISICSPFNFDNVGNVGHAKKDHQWLGAAMDRYEI